MKILRNMIICAPLLIIAFVFNVRAAELLCDELGANCVCSEPFNTNSLVYSNPYYNPSDSTSKECHAEGGTSGAITRNSNNLTASNASTILSALPSGNDINYVVKTGSSHTGILQFGTRFGSSQYLKRSAFRWYQYWSPDYQFKGDGSCENSKLGEHEYDTHLDLNNGNMIFYNFVQWSPARDLGIYGSVDFNQLRGRWWRIEVVWVNRHGKQQNQNSKVLVYMKNVTDNEPEKLILDSSKVYTGQSPPVDAMLANLYRQGYCGGYTAFSHYLAAGWDNDSGQRIGPAHEIEGNANSPASPSEITPPSNLRVDQ